MQSQLSPGQRTIPDRIRCVTLNPSALLSMLRGDHAGRAEMLPPDARVVASLYDGPSDLHFVFVHSETFEPVAPGQSLPELGSPYSSMATIVSAASPATIVSAASLDPAVTRLTTPGSDSEYAKIVERCEATEDAGDTPALIAQRLRERFEADLILESPPAEAPGSWRDCPPLL